METVTNILKIIAVFTALKNAFNYTDVKKDENGTTITIFFPKIKKTK